MTNYLNNDLKTVVYLRPRKAVNEEHADIQGEVVGIHSFGQFPLQITYYDIQQNSPVEPQEGDGFYILRISLN